MQTTVRVAGWPAPTVINNAMLTAMSSEARRGWRISVAISRSLRLKTKLDTVSSSSAMVATGAEVAPLSAAGVASARQTRRAVNTQRTSRT